jgi:hypothetical protein
MILDESSCDAFFLLLSRVRRATERLPRTSRVESEHRIDVRHLRNTRSHSIATTSAFTVRTTVSLRSVDNDRDIDLFDLVTRALSIKGTHRYCSLPNCRTSANAIGISPRNFHHRRTSARACFRRVINFYSLAFSFVVRW